MEVLYKICIAVTQINNHENLYRFCEETIRFDAGTAETCVIKIWGIPFHSKAKFGWSPHHSSGIEIPAAIIASKDG
jgi:hypothetical protein